jgi:hypothetical protein
MRILSNTFHKETYQDVLDRKYGGSIRSNIFVSDRELNSKINRIYKVDLGRPTTSGSIYGTFNTPFIVFKNYTRKNKIKNIFLIEE